MVWGKKGDRQKVWLSVDDGVLLCMFWFVLLHLYALCMVSTEIRECRSNVNLVYLPLQVLDEVLETTSCLRDRKLRYSVYRKARKAKFWVNRPEKMLEFIRQRLVRGSFKDRFLETNTTSFLKGVESKG